MKISVRYDELLKSEREKSWLQFTSHITSWQSVTSQITFPTTLLYWTCCISGTNARH